jgi:hypothetical protein
MDKQEENKRPFPPRTSMDKVENVKALIPTYEKRLEVFINKSKGELGEIDFITKEVRFVSLWQEPINQYTIGIKWDLFLKNLNLYEQFLKEQYQKFTEPVVQTRDRYSSNDQRLYALSILCPDFIKSLSKLSKKQSGELISIITNANPDDCYKKLITGKELKVDGEFKDKIKQFKSDIEK